MRLISKYSYLLYREESEIRDVSVDIDMLDPNFIENYGMVNLKEKFRLARKIKFKIIQEILNFFRWNFNFKTHKFSELTLENFGLQCCLNCDIQG